MYHRTREALRGRFQKIALRVSCWNLPPVATHLACFLVGTLLFEPDGSGKVPQGILVPWPAPKIDGGVHVTEEFNLIDADRQCLLIPQSFRIWQAEQKKIFVIVPKNRLIAESLSALQRSVAHLAPSGKNSAPFPHCEKKNVIIYP